MKITKDTLIGDLAQKHPDLVPILMNYGMHCIGCHMSAYETLEQGFQVHGLEEKEIDKIVEELNKALAKKKK